MLVMTTAEIIMNKTYTTLNLLTICVHFCWQQELLVLGLVVKEFFEGFNNKKPLNVKMYQPTPNIIQLCLN
ncbi:hypothetical protein HR45_07355 [Shewanella mangrovi]|uniref:Uncharacterized protein n=1 Tax=Shewanella mangrovi TaxID=1515746 RepID=A0A094LSY1_9GAMM|nr:hypothetical protein HR45_07355 [Shewanella mangrovi]